MTNTICTIYCLVNPINGKPFYVGCTIQSLEKRLISHLTYHKLRYGGKIVNKRCKLVRSIIAKNLQMKIIALDTCEIEKAKDMERTYYDKLISEGNDLIQSKYAFNYNSRKHLLQ